MVMLKTIKSYITKRTLVFSILLNTYLSLSLIYDFFVNTESISYSTSTNWISLNAELILYAVILCIVALAGYWNYDSKHKIISGMIGGAFLVFLISYSSILIDFVFYNYFPETLDSPLLISLMTPRLKGDESILDLLNHQLIVAGTKTIPLLIIAGGIIGGIGASFKRLFSKNIKS